MPTPAAWRPMHEAPQTIDRIWLNHLTLGPLLAEGRPGRWYAPSAARQVWRWYRPREANALEPFTGWLPFEALARDAAMGAAVPAQSGATPPIRPADAAAPRMPPMPQPISMANSAGRTGQRASRAS